MTTADQLQVARVAPILWWNHQNGLLFLQPATSPSAEPAAMPTLLTWPNPAHFPFSRPQCDWIPVPPCPRRSDGNDRNQYHHSSSCQHTNHWHMWICKHMKEKTKSSHENQRTTLGVEVFYLKTNTHVCNHNWTTQPRCGVSVLSNTY